MLFSQLVGQERALEKIRDAVAQNRLPHAMLLTGPSGVGALPLALAISQYVNCLSPTGQDSCGKCSNCIKLQKLIHPDLKILLPIFSKKLSGKSVLSDEYMEVFREAFLPNPYLNPSEWQQVLGGESKQLMISVQEIRELKRTVYLKAFEAPYKIVLIWQADRINVQGANALLKMLEEPPEKTLFLLTSSQPDRLLNTILSRCQRLPLERIERQLVEQYLINQAEVQAEVAAQVAPLAEGSIGNAQAFLDERTQSLSQAYMQWLRAVYAGNYAKIQEQLASVVSGSREWQKLFLQFALKKIRDALLFQLGMKEIALSPDSEQAFQEKFSVFATPERVEAISRTLEEGLRQISGNANPHMTFSALSLKIHQILRS